nr:putative zinc finger, CCHC-type [Tanacetum cinerariifolium]
MSELIAMCVQEEERLKVEKPNAAHVATTNSNKRKGSWKSKGSSGENSTPNKVQKTGTSTSPFQGDPKCKFCHRKGHTQKDCLKFKEWLAKKASNNIDLLHESKRFLSRNFDMKDLDEASYAIGIEIHRDRANGILGLSQKAYIKHILNRFNMQHFSPTVAPVKEKPKKDKIRSKPDKNGKRGEAGKSQKQLHWIEEEKLNKMQKEGP